MRQLVSALLLAVLVPSAASAQDVKNPINSASIGSQAQYVYECCHPSRVDVGRLDVKLLGRQDGKYTIEEVLTQGDAGSTKEKREYPLKSMMLAQVTATYSKRFEEFAISESEVTEQTSEVGEQSFDCKKLVIRFTAKYKTAKGKLKPVKGDLSYLIHSKAGPLGIVEFTSVISFETLPGKYGLSQTLSLRCVNIGPPPAIEKPDEPQPK